MVWIDGRITAVGDGIDRLRVPMPHRRGDDGHPHGWLRWGRFVAAHPLPLTVREREIANLVAAGLSNKDIADRLVVSVRTVEGHLYRACIKLDISDREDLAAAACWMNISRPLTVGHRRSRASLIRSVFSGL